MLFQIGLAGLMPFRTPLALLSLPSTPAGSGKANRSPVAEGGSCYSSYSDDEIMDFLYDEQKNLCLNTYCTRVAALKTFITSVERGRLFPIDVPTYKGETYSPSLSKDQVDALILAGCVFLEGVDLLRLATMTIYGARIGEVAALSHQHINLPNRTITIPVTKKERARPQPIPEFLMQVFSVPIKSCGKAKVRNDLKRWCRLAGFKLGPGVGVHAIRRAVATELDKAGVDILSLNIFGRWSTSRLGTAVRYIKNRKEATDLKVLEMHPFVETWKEAIPYLQKPPIVSLDCQ